MYKLVLISILALALQEAGFAQAAGPQTDFKRADVDTTIMLKEVSKYVFRNPKDGQEYALDIYNIRVVLPYVRIARRVYAEATDKKETDTKKQYRHFRRDMEKEMREKFEKEVKDLSIAQGKVLFKLLGRETGHNAYQIIKECKNGFTAWTSQIVAKHYTYDLKENYDPKKEWILEMAIRYLGSEYNPD